MPTPAEIISMTASLMNDTAQTLYTNAACLPYLNIALSELQEKYEQNNVPTTNEVSAVIAVPAGETVVKKVTNSLTLPQLPSDLIEIQRVWERESGVDPFVAMVRKEFLPHYLEGQWISQFLIWVWENDEIHLLPANQDNDLKLDYIKNIFDLPITISRINEHFPFENVKTFLGYKTASLCSMFIGENQSRAQILEAEAQLAMDRTLSISTKGRQAITTRRRPFRAGYKSRGWF